MLIMEITRLIQRLEKPKGFVNPFSFGASGNGGLGKEAQELLKNIWSFEYMGSAQFESGAVPEALYKIAGYCSSGNAVNSFIRLVKPVYYICERKEEDEVIDRIKKLAKSENKHFNLKSWCGLERNLKGEESAQRLSGWLELDNGFMFFVDKEMYDKVFDLFLKD